MNKINYIITAAIGLGIMGCTSNPTTEIRVQMYGPDNRPYTVPLASVEQAKTMGYRLATPEMVRANQQAQRVAITPGTYQVIIGNSYQGCMSYHIEDGRSLTQVNGVVWTTSFCSCMSTDRGSNIVDIAERNHFTYEDQLVPYMDQAKITMDQTKKCMSDADMGR